MGYTPQQWSDLDPSFPASAARFAFMEGGIKGNSDRLDAVEANKLDAAAGDARYDALGAAALRAPSAAARPGNRVVYLGDSLTQWQDNPGLFAQRVSLANLASILSNQQALYVRNAGIGGNTTQQMLDRFDTDVTPYTPTCVHLLGGTNDTAASTPLATITTNLTTLVGKIRAIGAVPVLGTIPPNSSGTPADRKARITALNTWIKRYAAQQGIAVADYYRTLTDPVNANYLAAYNNDGTHPSDAGFMAMAQTCADTLAAVLPAWTPPLAQDNVDPNNLIVNGLFLTTGAATGTGAANWTGGTGTGITPSIITGDTAIRGNWVKLDCAASAGAAQVYQNLAAAPVPGHRYLLAGKVKSSWTSGSGVMVRNRLTGSATTDVSPLLNMAVTINDGTFYSTYTCPDGATAQQVMFQFAAGTGSVQVAQMTLYDLTALGIA